MADSILWTQQAKAKHNGQSLTGPNCCAAPAVWPTALPHSCFCWRWPASKLATAAIRRNKHPTLTHEENSVRRHMQGHISTNTQTQVTNKGNMKRPDEHWLEKNQPIFSQTQFSNAPISYSVIYAQVKGKLWSHQQVPVNLSWGSRPYSHGDRVNIASSNTKAHPRDLEGSLVFADLGFENESLAVKTDLIFHVPTKNQ